MAWPLNPFDTTCRRCRRVRAALVLGCLLLLAAALLLSPRERGASAAGSGPALPPAVPQTLPSSAASVAPAASATSASAPTPVPAASQAGLKYTRLQLARLVVGREWKGLLLVDNTGKAAVAPELVSGQLPPGLKLGADGWLRGTPATEGRFDFVLRLAGGSVADPQPYRIDVVPVPSTKPAGPALITKLPAAPAEPVDPNPAEPRSWRLAADDLKALTKRVPEPGEEVGEDGQPLGPPAVVSPYQAAVLEPLLEIEYPSEAMFRQALQASWCRTYLQTVKDEAARQKREPDLRCPPPGAKAKSTAAAEPDPNAEKTLAQAYASMLEPANEARVVAAAVKRQPDTSRPLLLEASPGCGCTRQDSNDDVHGFIAYWHADGKPQRVDFSLYTRLNYLGATLRPSGTWALTTTDDAEGLRFVREAQQHGTQVDLVLHRRDWRFLRAQNAEQRADFIRTAVKSAMDLARLPMVDATASWQALLLPFWRENERAFGGLTLFFEDPPLDGDDKALFATFMAEFMKALMKAMSDTKATYRLNVVMPDTAVGRDGIFSADQLAEWQGIAEANLGALAKPRRLAMASGTPIHELAKPDIQLEFIVLLSEGTSAAKKALRARLDQSENVTGHNRVALLQGLAPLLVNKRYGAPEGMPKARYDQLDDDFAYMRWNYGGVALWPLPVPGRGRGEAAQSLVKKNYGVVDAGAAAGTDAAATSPGKGQIASAGSALGREVCAFVCPQRVPLRLLMQLLLLVGLASVGAYAFSCEVRRLRNYLRYLFVGGVATTVLFLLLLSCDPALEAWRRNNVILYLPLALLVALGARALFKPAQART